MTSAEEKTYKFIRLHHSDFLAIDVLEILPFLPCLTTSDQDRLRASYTRLGNRDTLWELFNTLQRRTGWVDTFIQALRQCELSELSDQVNCVYQSSQHGIPLQVPGPMQAPEVPARVPAARPSDVPHSIPHNGYQEEPSYPQPVQDTQPPKSSRESSEHALQMPSLGTSLRRPSGPLEPSSNLPVLSPLTPSRHQEQKAELGSTHGPVSSLTSPRGPVSPTVSFQPLARSTPRASHLPGPTVSPMSVSPSFSSPSSMSLPSAGAAGNQARASTCPSEVPPEVPTTSVSTSSVPSPATLEPVRTVTSKVPASPVPVSTVLSTVPTSSEFPGANVPIHPAPSQLPVNPTHIGITPSKVSTEALAKTLLSERSSHTEKETPETPAPTATIGGSSPWPNSSSGSPHFPSEMSKPSQLESWQDGQPCSICSADLAISPSSSLASEPSHGPEENEYKSFGLHVAEDPSVNIMAGNPGPHSVLEPKEEQEEETKTSWSAPWASWVGAAVASALLAVFLAVLYRRRPPQ